MNIRFHPHAIERMKERGADEKEVIGTIQSGEKFPAKFGRTGFRRNFSFNKSWIGRAYKTKQIEALAIKKEADWLVITVITKYF
ncbi:MAG: DUF4258 domain-containing protein [PVC group bacterium]